MTISSTNRKAGPYTGNGVATSFPFGFKVFSASDLYVVRADALGAETVLALTTDYTVALNTDQNANPGGSVMPVSVLASGFTLTLTSSLAYLQATDLTNAGGFYPKVINNALDRLTIFVQQLAEAVGRSLKNSISTPPGVSSTLPIPVANNVIGWNAAANGFQNYAPVDNTLLSAALAASSGATLAGYASRTVAARLDDAPSGADYLVSSASALATWQAAYAAGVSAKNDVTLAGRAYTLNGELALDAAANTMFAAPDGGSVGGFNNVPVRDSTKAQWGVEAWNPTVSHSVVYSGAFYDHQPVVVRDLDDSYLAIWNGNPTTATEGAAGQRVYAAKSVDGGATWSGRYELFNNAAYISNPHVVTDTQWQPRAGRLTLAGNTEIWSGYSLGRGSANQGAFIAKKTATGGLFTQYRILRNTATGAISLRAELAAADIPAGYSILMQADGRDWFAHPQAINQLRNGNIVIACTLIHPTDSFSIAEKRFACLIFNGAAWSMSTIAPVGVMGKANAWEVDILEIESGTLKAFIRANDLTLASGNRQAVSYSSDGGQSWTPCEWLDLLTHQEQPSTVQFNHRHAVLALPDNYTNRNARALFLVNDASITPALTLSNEVDGVDFAHVSYVDVDYKNGKVLMVYSVGAVAGVPREIRFSSISVAPSASALNLLLRKNAAYELDNAGHIATWDTGSKQLTLAGSASAGLELPAGSNLVSVKFKLGAIPSGAIPATIAVLGSQSNHIMWRIDEQGGLLNLQMCLVRNRGIAESISVLSSRGIGSVTELHSIVFAYDANTGDVYSEGRSVRVPTPLTCILGDGYNNGLTPTTAALIIDLSGAVVSRTNPDALRRASNYLGRNLLLNGSFRWDQQRAGASAYTAVGPVMDGWTLSDEGGSAYTVQRSAYSSAFAAIYSNNWQYYVQIDTAGLGSTQGKIRQWFDGCTEYAGMIGTLALTADDAGAKAYNIDVYWTVDYGVGGSALSSTLIGSIQIDSSNSRRIAFPFSIPSVDSTATIGTGSRCALEFRIPSNEVDGIGLRIAMLDLFEGIGTRDFEVPSIVAEEAAIKHRYEVIAATDVFTEFFPAYAQSATEARGVLKFAEKRVVPTVSFSGSFQFASSTNSSLSGFSGTRKGVTTCGFSATASGLTAGMAGSLRANNDATAKIIIDARHVA